MKKAEIVNTKPKKQAIVVVAKVFSILAALLLGLTALFQAASSGEQLVYVFGAWNRVPEIEHQALVASFIIRVAAPMVMSALMMISALVLSLDRKGPFVFIPMGLLTYTALASAAGVVADVMISLVLDGTDRFYYYHYAINAVSEALIIAACLPVAIIIAAFLFIAAATFCRKCRFVPMIILTAIFGGGFVANVVVALIGMIARIEKYQMHMLFPRSDMLTLSTLNYFIAPILGTLVVGLLAVASLLAIFGVLSAKKKPAVAVAEAVEAECAEEHCAEPETVAENVATDATAEPVAE